MERAWNKRNGRKERREMFENGRKILGKKWEVRKEQEGEGMNEGREWEEKSGNRIEFEERMDGGNEKDRISWN